MCLLVCVRNADGGLLVAANRDERYDRPSRRPFLWPTDPPVLAGRDERAGGTWLAVNACGLLAAVTNRPTAGGDDPTRPSRGELPLLACRCLSAADARAALAERLADRRYNGFNLLVADAEAAFAIEAPGAAPAFRDVPPGLHAVANGAWDDPADARVARALELRKAGPPDADSLAALCRDDRALPDGTSLCLHGPEAGTVSSTVLHVDSRRRLRLYLHAAGPPCRTDYLPLAGGPAGPAFAQ